MNVETLPLTRELYETAQDYPEFVGEMRANQDLVAELRNEAAITEEDKREIAALVKRRGGALHIAVLTEDRCIDSANNLPIVEAIADSVPGIDLKIFHLKKFEELNAAYNEAGIDHIPAVTFLDSKWNIIGHWVERPVAASAKLNEWKAEHRSEIERLESSGTLEDKRKLREIYRSIGTIMASWYRGGLWSETISEIKKVIADGHL